MSSLIHSTAIIAEDACLSDGVQVGPYAVIGSGVRLGCRGLCAQPEKHDTGISRSDGCYQVLDRPVLGILR